MPFNPTLPANNSEIRSAELRDQFNALKALIDDLTVRVAALESPTYTATGFGDAASNGLLTPVGTFNGQPFYQTAGGDYVFLTTDPVSPGWRIGANHPTMDETPVKYSTGTATITDPWIVYIAGIAPAGTIT